MFLPMLRKLRIEYPGTIYHVINRGNQRGNIFKDDHDRQRFLATLGEACAKTEWQIHVWCLMRNHFHLKTPQANLVAGMKWLLGVYTRRYNIRQNMRPPLRRPLQSIAGRWQRHRLLPNPLRLGDYVHLNPVRTKLLELQAKLESFPWSSYSHYRNGLSEFI
jgi:putative transposase